MEVKSFECFVTLQSSWCIYVSWVKSWEDFGLDPSLFAPNCKLWDVFHLLSSVFIKYLRNKINTLFVCLQSTCSSPVGEISLGAFLPDSKPKSRCLTTCRLFTGLGRQEGHPVRELCRPSSRSASPQHATARYLDLRFLWFLSAPRKGFSGL